MQISLTLHAQDVNTPAASQTSQASPDTLLIFTHGEAASSYLKPDGSFAGPAIDAGNCAAAHMGMTVDWQLAPLSRAEQVLVDERPMMWTPATPGSSLTADRPFLGPVSTVDIFWYMRRGDTRDPMSDSFKAEALVTAYPGSRTIGILAAADYRVVTGRPEHQGMLDLLFRQRVDALLAVDFRHQLTPQMVTRFNEEVRLTRFRSFDVGFSPSDGMARNQSALLEAFDKALAVCLSGKDNPTP